MNKPRKIIALRFPKPPTSHVGRIIADTEYIVDCVPAVERDGQIYFDFQDWEKAEYMIADDLITRKIVTGETFKYLRKTLGIGISNLAKALYHPKLYPDPEKSIRDWESGAIPVDLAVWERLVEAIKKGPARMDPELTNAEAMAEVREEE